MYQSIYVPLDNSDHSNAAMDLSVALGARLRAAGAPPRLTGSHIYAAALHDVRFKQMEFTLPDEYKEETELEKQRRIHDALIVRGLQLISDSYLAPMAALCEDAEVPFEGKTFDGKNFDKLVEDIAASDYDLVLLGALGQGAVKPSTAGSVCERVLRRADRDLFIVRDPGATELEGEASIVVAIDGSATSWGAFERALGLADLTGRPVEVVAVHEGEPTIEDLLDEHLKLARRIARDRRVAARLTTLDGVPGAAIVAHLADTSPWLVVVGRAGLDAAAAAPSVGSVTEHLVRHAPCNVLAVARTSAPAELASAPRAEA